MYRAVVSFNEAKAAQVAARLLSLEGGRMSYMKLIKLLYIVDRRALADWGRPVSTDHYVSMKHGPVLSRVLDLINEGRDPKKSSSPWHDLISAPQGYEVALVATDPPNDELSAAEEGLIDEVQRQHRQRNEWQMVEFVHQFTEWQDPGSTSNPIDYRDILKAVGKTSEEAGQIEDELSAGFQLDHLLAK